MKIHKLKTWPQYFKPVADGLKNFEIRQDDRGFEVGDLLYLAEWDPKTESFTGAWQLRRVVYRTEPGCPFLGPGMVTMGMRKVHWAELPVALLRVWADRTEARL